MTNWIQGGLQQSPKGKPDCPHCHGQGFIMVSADFGANGYPYAKPMTCKCVVDTQSPTRLTVSHAAESLKDLTAEVEGRICPQDGSTCFGPCDVEYCQLRTDSVELQRLTARNCGNCQAWVQLELLRDRGDCLLNNDTWCAGESCSRHTPVTEAK